MMLNIAASLRSLLYEASFAGLADGFNATVITDFDETGYKNRYYNSRLDDLQSNGGDSLSVVATKLAVVAEGVAKGLWKHVTGEETTVPPANSSLVGGLLSRVAWRASTGGRCDCPTTPITHRKKHNYVSQIISLLECYTVTTNCSLARQLLDLPSPTPTTPINRYVGVSSSAQSRVRAWRMTAKRAASKTAWLRLACHFGLRCPGRTFTLPSLCRGLLATSD